MDSDCGPGGPCGAADLSGEIVEGPEADVAWQRLCAANPEGTVIDDFLIALPPAPAAGAVMQEPEPGVGVTEAPANTAREKPQPHQMLLPQTMLGGVQLEYSVHKLTPMLTRTLKMWGKNTITDAAKASAGEGGGESPKTFDSIVSNCIGARCGCL